MRALVLAVALSLAAGCGTKRDGGGSDPEKGSPAPPPAKADRLKPSVNAGTLWLEYGANEAKADEDYTGRRVTVGGDVHSVVSRGDGYEVRFTVFATEGPDDVEPGTVARFPATETPKVTKLKPLEMCYLQGRCVGRVAGGRNGYTVVLEDCRIIAEPKY